MTSNYSNVAYCTATGQLCYVSAIDGSYQPITLPVVRGPPGTPGQQGRDGRAGRDGLNGVPLTLLQGLNGKDGAPAWIASNAYYNGYVVASGGLKFQWGTCDFAGTYSYPIAFNSAVLFMVANPNISNGTAVARSGPNALTQIIISGTLGNGTTYLAIGY